MKDYCKKKKKTSEIFIINSFNLSSAHSLPPGAKPRVCAEAEVLQGPWTRAEWRHPPKPVAPRRPSRQGPHPDERVPGPRVALFRSVDIFPDSFRLKEAGRSV